MHRSRRGAIPKDHSPVLALLLSIFPLATAALTLRLARPLAGPERAVVGIAVALAAASAVLAPQAPIHDQWTHYVHLRDALADPVRLLDPWDRPGFTLLYAGPAALGLRATRLTSVLVAALALVATMRAARTLGLARPWAAGVLLLAQYDFFGQASSTMTELPFAAALAVAIWALTDGRPGTAAAALSWAAITRPEGPLFAALGAAVLLRERRIALAALALGSYPLYLAVGWAATGDPLWWYRANPYRGLVGPRLDPGQLLESFFFVALRRGQPVLLLALEAAGAALALAGPARRLRFLLAPLAVSFLLLTFLRIGVTDDWRESRYLVAVAPALALLAARALDAALERFPRAAPPALLALAGASAAAALTWHWRAALPGGGIARAGVYTALLGVAVLLWAARRHLSPAAGVAVLLVLPLALAPPGAFGNLRPDGGATSARGWARPLSPRPPGTDGRGPRTVHAAGRLAVTLRGPTVSTVGPARSRASSDRKGTRWQASRRSTSRTATRRSSISG